MKIEHNYCDVCGTDMCHKNNAYPCKISVSAVNTSNFTVKYFKNLDIVGGNQLSICSKCLKKVITYIGEELHTFKQTKKVKK